MEKKLERFGTFSSSSMWKLMTDDKKGGMGAPAKKYIKNTTYEIKLGRAINPERESRPTSWGKLCEGYAFSLLGLEYSLVSKGRLVHPYFHFWTGMPDVIKDKAVGDIKCPFSLDVFCSKVESLQDIDVYKKEFPEDYWQHISSAILTKSDFFEAIIFCPYQSELEDIRELARNTDEGVMSKYYWIHNATDEELPYLIEGGHYKNLNIIRFKVPQADKDFLTERVAAAGKLLEEFKSIAV